MKTRAEILGLKYEETVLPNGTIEVKATPPVWAGFNGGASVILTRDQHRRFCWWREHGGLIQDALPDLNNDQREILMTGIGPKEWDRMFPEVDR